MGLVDAFPTIAEVQKSLGSDSGCVLAIRNVKTGKGRPIGSVVKPPSWTQSYWNCLSHQEKVEKKTEYNKTKQKRKRVARNKTSKTSGDPSQLWYYLKFQRRCFPWLYWLCLYILFRLDHVCICQLITWYMLYYLYTVFCYITQCTLIRVSFQDDLCTSY